MRVLPTPGGPLTQLLALTYSSKDQETLPEKQNNAAAFAFDHIIELAPVALLSSREAQNQLLLILWQYQTVEGGVAEGDFMNRVPIRNNLVPASD